VAQVRKAKPGLTLWAELSDSFGRVLTRKTLSVPVGDNVEVKVPLTIDRPLATVAAIHVDLKAGDRTLDQADLDFVTYPDRYVQRTWDEFEWIPMGSGMRLHSRLLGSDSGAALPRGRTHDAVREHRLGLRRRPAQRARGHHSFRLSPGGIRVVE